MTSPTPIEPDSPANNLILVIDDDEIMRLSCEQVLKKAGYRVETFGNGRDGIERLGKVRPFLLVVDIKMPELDGFEVISIVRKLDPDLVIVVITGYTTIETAVDAMKAGAYDFLPKPFTPNELRLIVDRGLERWRLTKQAERLRQEKDELERRLVSLVSHQLKTPLIAVKQYLDVLLFSKRDQLGDKTVEWLTRSQLRLGEMLTLIQDWLALSKIEGACLCDRKATCDLGPVVKEIVEQQRQLPAAAATTINVELVPDLPLLCGDRASVAMLVSNLVDNAVKYNRAGGSVSIRASASGNNVVLQVSDTGIGIPAESIPRLFQEFYRVRTKQTQDITGTGLGLVICKRIVIELGGTIEVTSQEGKGTMFTVRLPAAETHTEAQRNNALKPTQGESQ